MNLLYLIAVFVISLWWSALTHREDWRPILAFFKTHPSELHHLSLDTSGDGQADETLTGTGEHPFWVEDSGEFTPMRDLVPGMRLTTARSGPTATVLANTRERAPPGGSFTTYNFEVAGFHTYFVGNAGVWVHNAGKAECEKIFTMYTYMRRNRLGNGVNETPYQTFIHMLETLKSSPNAAHNQLADAAFDFNSGQFNGRAIRFALKAMNDEMFELVAKEDLPVAALPTMVDIAGKFKGIGAAGKIKVGDMHRHHLLEKDYYNRLFNGNPEHVPAYILEAADHVMAGGIRPELVRLIGQSNDEAMIFWGHVDTYNALGHGSLSQVFMRWWTETMNRPIPQRPQ